MISTKNIIQQGELAKYQLIIDREGFSMTEGDFRVRLDWGMRGQQLTITKADMVQNEGGETFLQFDTTDMVGVVTATVSYDVPDSDFASGVRPEVERQPLCYVATQSRIPTGGFEGVYQSEHVAFIRQKRSGLRTLFRILRDVMGRTFHDSNGQTLRVLKQN